MKEVGRTLCEKLTTHVIQSVGEGTLRGHRKPGQIDDQNLSQESAGQAEEGMQAAAGTRAQQTHLKRWGPCVGGQADNSATGGWQGR